MTKSGWPWHKIGYKIFIGLEILFISWILYEFVILYVTKPGKMHWFKEGSRIIKTTE